jgi:hypothetical protein
MCQPQEPLTDNAILNEDLHWFLREHGCEVSADPAKQIKLSELFAWIRENYRPEHVFSESDLRERADANDYSPDRALTGRAR